jgi:hypothetical protein
MEAGVAAVEWAVVIFLAYISLEAIPRLQYVVSCEFASLLSPTLSPARFPIDLCRRLPSFGSPFLQTHH